MIDAVGDRNRRLIVRRHVFRHAPGLICDEEIARGVKDEGLRIGHAVLNRRQRKGLTVHVERDAVCAGVRNGQKLTHVDS